MDDSPEFGKDLEGDIGPRRDSCSFYVTGVPPVVFETDPEASIRVRL